MDMYILLRPSPHLNTLFCHAVPFDRILKFRVHVFYFSNFSVFSLCPLKYIYNVWPTVLFFHIKHVLVVWLSRPPISRQPHQPHQPLAPIVLWLQLSRFFPAPGPLHIVPVQRDILILLV